MCFRKLSFFKTKNLAVTLWICDTTQYLKDISHLKIACCYLKEFLRLLWLWSRQEELVYFSLKSVTLQSHQGRSMQEFTRPIHLPGVSEGHLEATSQRQQSTSSPPACWRNWDLRQELSWQGPVSQQESGSWSCSWAGCNAGVTRIHWSSGKELGTMVSYAREPCACALNCCNHCSLLALQRAQERSAEGVILEGEFFPTCLPLSECQAGGSKAMRHLGCWSHCCWYEAGRWL